MMDLMDRGERASPRMKVGDFLSVHGDWEDALKPILGDISKLEG